jgi:hypothetical protein
VDSLKHTGKQSLAHEGGNFHSKRGFTGRREKVWKVKKTKRRMVMGVDVGLEESCNLSLCALVGRLSYRSLCNHPIIDWMQISWVPLLGYYPDLLTLSRGWFGFVFKNPEDTVLILERLWVFEGSSLMLKCWRVRFDPISEYFSFRHLWVLLPGLTLQLWNAKALEAIGNELGRFIKVDEIYLQSPDKIMAKVLVEVDLHPGLLEILEIDWRGLILVQILDYLGIPFRCTLCWRTGHLRRDCQHFVGDLDLEATMFRNSKDLYTQGEDSQEVVDFTPAKLEDRPKQNNLSFVGKLKQRCPSLLFFLISMGT